MKRLLPTALLIGFAAAASAQELPPGKAGDLIDDKCSTCHTLSRVTSQSRDREEWTDSVKAMVGYGTELTPAEQTTIIDFLAKYFGLPVNVNQASAAELQKEFELSQKDAEAIVETRKDKGAFREWNDLAKVPGLDLKKLEFLRDRFKFN